MTHTYQVTGMTCSGCENNVKKSLLALPGITAAEVSKDNNSATLTMDKHVDLSTLQKALGDHYQINLPGKHSADLTTTPHQTPQVHTTPNHQGK